MKTIIEIGGFDGEDTEKYLKDDSFVYCFEANKELANQLEKRFSGKKNIKIINKAVGSINGIIPFYIAENKMSSSINKLSKYNIDNNITKYETVTHIESVKLDTFIKDNMINHIDYFHCDAQGSDLDILKSLGNHISIIKRGQVEGSRNENLYETQNNYLEIIKYLEEHNFIVLNKDEIQNRINWHDLNIFFVNKKYQLLL